MERFRSRSQPATPCENSHSKQKIHRETAVNTKFHFQHARGAAEPKMSSHVILLTDAHEAPAYELIEALRAAGVKTLIEGLREVEVEVALTRQQQDQNLSDLDRPLAVLYEVVPGADMVELHTA